MHAYMEAGHFRCRCGHYGIATEGRKSRVVELFRIQQAARIECPVDLLSLQPCGDLGDYTSTRLTRTSMAKPTIQEYQGQ